LGGTGQTSASAAFDALLPTQTNNANKLLGTDGTSASWVSPGIAYQTSAPDNPVTGQLWVDSDETGDSLDPYIIRRKTITATAGQTVFTTDVVFTDGYEQIYYNGVLLVRTTDYTTSGGTNTVTLLQGASAGDTVEIISSTPINLINAATLSTNTFIGNQGIGGSPSFPVHQIGTVAPNIAADTYSSTAGPAYLGRRSRGTIVSPSATQAGDGLNAFIGRGYGSTGFGANNVAAILLNAEENFTDSSQPTYIDFGTTASGSISRSQRMRIDSAGRVGIGLTPVNFILETVSPGSFRIGTNQFFIAGGDAASASSPNTYVGIHYDATNNRAVFDALSGGVAWRDIAINSRGGNTILGLAGGKVGIGIASPTAQLHLSFNSGSDVNSALIGNFTGAGGTDFRLIRNSIANSQSVRTFRIRGGNDFDSFTSFELGMESNHPLRFITNNIERMRITADGLVDMGAFSPNHTLTDSTARTYSANTWYTLPGTLLRPPSSGSYFLQITIQYNENQWHSYAGACVLGIVQWKFGGTLPTITIPLDRHAEDSINVSIRPEIGNGTATISVNFSSTISVAAGGFVQIKAKRMF
jgi:hypothetical protein